MKINDECHDVNEVGILNSADACSNVEVHGKLKMVQWRYTHDVRFLGKILSMHKTKHKC